MYNWLREDHGLEESQYTVGVGSKDNFAARVINALRKVRACIVLDGLEKLQTIEAEGREFGRLHDPGLHDLLLRIGSGLLPGVCAIVSSRYAISDLEIDESPLCRAIAVERLSAQACVDLFVSRGVKGSEQQLYEPEWSVDIMH